MVWQSYIISTQAKQHKPNIFSPDRRSFGKICRQGNDGNHFERVSYSSWFACLILMILFARICNYLLFFVILCDSIGSLCFWHSHSVWVSWLSWFSPPGCRKQWKQWIRSDWSEKINLGASRVQRAMQNIVQHVVHAVCPGMSRAFPCISQFPSTGFRLWPRPCPEVPTKRQMQVHLFTPSWAR